MKNLMYIVIVFLTSCLGSDPKIVGAKIISKKGELTKYILVFDQKIKRSDYMYLHITFQGEEDEKIVCETQVTGKTLNPDNKNSPETIIGACLRRHSEESTRMWVRKNEKSKNIKIVKIKYTSDPSYSHEKEYYVFAPKN